MNKEEIVFRLDKNVADILHFVETLNEEDLTISKNEKWTSIQHLEHLLRSTQPLTKALRIPVPGLRVLFGRINRSERSFQEVVKKYKDKLNAGGKASGRYIPDSKASIKKLTKKYKEQSEKLKEVILKWDENDMSSCLLPHPLLGKLTIREMLFFTIYHTEHHLQLMEANLAIT